MTLSVDNVSGVGLLQGSCQRNGSRQLYLDCLHGLRQSSLFMGVHPGCPVCLIVAASLVAVETDVGETISAAEVAFVCGLWSLGVVALLSAGPFSYFCIRQLLFR